jgi:ERAP1-like C-terminal domain
MLPVLGIEASEPVARAAFGPLARVEEEILTPPDRPAFHSWVRTLLAPQLARVGREPKPDEADDTRTLGALLLRLLADAAADGETIAYLRAMTDAYLADPASVDPALADVALPVAARHGDATLYARLTAALDKASAPAMHDQVEHALALVRDPAPLQRTLRRLLNRRSGTRICSASSSRRWPIPRRDRSCGPSSRTTSTKSSHGLARCPPARLCTCPGRSATPRCATMPPGSSRRTRWRGLRWQPESRAGNDMHPHAPARGPNPVRVAASTERGKSTVSAGRSREPRRLA